LGLLNKSKKWLLVIALVGLAFLVIPNLEFLSIDNIVGYAEISIWITALGFIILYVIKGLAMIVPSSLLYIAAGITFNTWSGILVTYIGLTISLSIGYLIGNRLGEEKVNKMFAKRKKIKNFLSGSKENVLWLCFISRLLHLPFGLVSLFMGALGVPFHKHIFASLLGVSPIMIPTIFAGAAISNPLSAAFLVPFAVSLVITLGVLIVYKRKIAAKPIER